MQAPPVRAEAAISALPRPLGEEWRNSELHKILKALRQHPGPAASSRQRSLFTEDRAEGGEGREGEGWWGAGRWGGGAGEVRGWGGAQGGGPCSHPPDPEAAPCRPFWNMPPR